MKQTVRNCETGIPPRKESFRGWEKSGRGAFVRGRTRGPRAVFHAGKSTCSDDKDGLLRIVSYKVRARSGGRMERLSQRHRDQFFRYRRDEMHFSEYFSLSMGRFRFTPAHYVY